MYVLESTEDKSVRRLWTYLRRVRHGRSLRYYTLFQAECKERSKNVLLRNRIKNWIGHPYGNCDNNFLYYEYSLQIKAQEKLYVWRQIAKGHIILLMTAYINMISYYLD